MAEKHLPRSGSSTGLVPRIKDALPARKEGALTPAPHALPEEDVGGSITGPMRVQHEGADSALREADSAEGRT